MKIFDAFLFNGEFECFEIRMAELKGLPVTHILIESNQTFTGNEKKLTFFGEYENVYVRPFLNMPNTGNAWDNETAQRDSILDAINELGANDEDIVIISDADEIPKRTAIESYKPEMGITSLRMDNFWYKFNCMIGRQEWTAAKVLTYGELKKTSPNKVRNGGVKTVLDLSGWHYSYCGDAAFISNKLQSFSHVEHNTEDAKDLPEIQRKIDAGVTLWGDAKLEYVTLDAAQYVMENQVRFKHLIKE